MAGVLAAAGLIGVRATSAAHRASAAPRARVLVEVFENRTGDSRLASVGRVAQDWLSQGIIQTELVDVVDPRAIYVQSHLAGDAADPATLARHTGATVLVSGSYFRTGDTLFFSAAITNAKSGRLASVVGPILSSVRNPVVGLDELRSRVMSAVATAVEVRGTMDIHGPEVPPFEAYSDYVDGWDAFWHGDGPHAQMLFLKASRRDTAFTPAALAASMTASNYNHCVLSDSIDHALEERSPPLDRKDRLTVRIIDARCRGRNDDMLRLTLERADLDPHSPGNLTPAAAAASWANRPGLQLELLRRVNPAVDLAWNTDSTHITYWEGLTGALHSLGRYREELAVSDRMTPGAPLTRAWIRATALAALGRPTASLAMVDTALTLPVETANDLGIAPYTNGRPEYSATPGWIAWWVGCELAVHGRYCRRAPGGPARGGLVSQPSSRRACDVRGTPGRDVVARHGGGARGRRAARASVAARGLGQRRRGRRVGDAGRRARRYGAGRQPRSVARGAAGGPRRLVRSRLPRAASGPAWPARQRRRTHSRSDRRGSVAGVDSLGPRFRSAPSAAGLRGAHRSERLTSGKCRNFLILSLQLLEDCRCSVCLLPLFCWFVPIALSAQDPGVAVRPFDQKHGGSKSVHMLAHVVNNPGAWKAADIEMEQDPDRPYVYVCGFINFDTQIYDVKEPTHPKRIFRWHDREPRAAPRHRGDGREVLQDRTDATTTRSRFSSCRAAPTPTSAP